MKLPYLLIALLPFSIAAKVMFIVGPSGVGKSTVIKKLVEESDGALRFGVAHTTRAMRATEQEGVDYHFVSQEQYDTLKKEGGFAYTSEQYGNCYGISAKEIHTDAPDRWMIKDMGPQGLDEWRRILGDEVTFVFLEPPSLEALKERLIERAEKTGESAESIERRFQAAKREMAHKEECDYVIVAENVEKTASQIRAIMKSR